MNRFLLSKLMLCSALLAPFASWGATEVKGVKFEDTYNLGGQTLELNGAGVRVKLIVSVYAAGLYVPHKEHSAAAVLSPRIPHGIEIVLLRDLSGQEFADAMVKGFRKNNNEADVARYQAKLDELRARMAAFGSVKKGTVIHIDHVPNGGTHVLVNGEQKGPVIEGDDFFVALLKIWLGQHPVDGDLKEALLGGQ